LWWEGNVDYHITVTEVASQTTAVVRRQASLEELSTIIPQACSEVWAFIRPSQLPEPGRNVVVYLDHQGHLECGVEVALPFVGSDTVVCSRTPAGWVAIATHLGPYERLPDAHVAIRRWCAAHGYALTGGCWEVYGHWHDDPEQRRTEVCYPAKAFDGPAT
jgi:effector-binding domain-containing protein